MNVRRFDHRTFISNFAHLLQSKLIFAISMINIQQAMESVSAL